RGEQWRGLFAMQEDMAMDLFIACDLYIIEDDDTHGLNETQQGQAEFAGMQLCLPFVADEMLDTGEAEAAELFILQTEDLLFSGDLFHHSVERVDVGAQLVTIGAGDEFVAAVAFQSDLFILKDFADLFEAFEAEFG